MADGGVAVFIAQFERNPVGAWSSSEHGRRRAEDHCRELAAESGDPLRVPVRLAVDDGREDVGEGSGPVHD